MRKLLSLSMVALVALAVGACDEPLTDPAATQTPAVKASHGSHGSHGTDGVVEASAVYRAVGTEAAGMNGLQRGERVGTLSVTDDGSDLTVTGEASGLDPEVVYVSLFYDKRSSVQGSPESGNAATNASACEPGLGEDHPQFLTAGQMEIGPGTSPGPLAWWDVDPDGTATLGPTSTHEYVSVKKIGTVSIRDTRIAQIDLDGDGEPEPGTGPEAVVACGVVTLDPANPGD